MLCYSTWAHGRPYRTWLVWSVLYLIGVGCMTSTVTLTETERARLDPRLWVIWDDTGAASHLNAIQRDGQRAYAVIVHSTAFDAVRTANLPLASVFGGRATTHWTRTELQHALRLDAVTYIEAPEFVRPTSP